MKKNHIYVADNPDKTKHQKWGDKNHPISNIINLPRPYSMLLTAQPNAGKSNCIKNILIHMEPVPHYIYLLHAECFEHAAKSDDPFNKKIEKITEYDGVKAIYLKTFPELEFWDKNKDKHKLLIIDDVNLKQWASNDRQKLNLLDKYWSWLRTHRNLTIIAAFQSIYQQCLPAIYRYSNVFVIWKMRDMFIQSMLGRVCGISADQWRSLFSLCESSYDNIMIDDTLSSPVRLRFNLATPITLASPDSDSEDEC